MYIVIVGMGEVGSALATLLKDKHYVYGDDLDIARQLGHPLSDKQPATLHVAIRWTVDDFSDAVAAAVEQHRPHGVVVHSTVPVGTTRDLGDRLGIPVAHAPIRGVHPNMVPALLAFPMAFSGEYRLSDGLVEAGINVHYAGHKTETTEVMKLLDLTYYAWNIAFAKESAELCDELGLDYDVVYRWANETYNNGFQLLGRPEVTRPVLDPVPGPIGGHCVVPGFKMLADQFSLAEFLRSWHSHFESERKFEPPVVAISASD